tara:strand:+ start:90 stop:344 length:255 start_codon:yes stop_codon:yes gene_type:complete
MNDGMVLDAMNQLKEMNEKREKELEDMKEELSEYKKEMITAYGVIRLIDMIYKDTPDQIPEINVLVETLREYLSQFAEEHLGIE